MLEINVQDRVDPAALLGAADQAMGSGDYRATVDLLERYLIVATPRPGDWLRLAAARRAVGDLVGALDAIGEVIRLQPGNFMALLMGGSLLRAMGRREEAARTYGVALNYAPDAQRLPPRLAQEIVQARAYVAADQAWRHDVSTWAPNTALSPDAMARIETFRARILAGRQHRGDIELPYPDLPPAGFVDSARVPAIAALEAATDVIRQEYRDLLAAKAEARAPVSHDGVGTSGGRAGTWSALHLFLNGELVEDNARHCPETVRLYRALCPPAVPGRSPNLMFSLLDPHTCIPAHRGVSNTRLVLHIPLIIPSDCAIRVGDETRAWRPGKALLFDDTIEHEAWNDSDDLRVILLGDVWRPELGESERAAVAALMARTDR